MKNNKILNLNNRELKKSTSHVINMEDMSIKEEDISIKLQQGLCEPSYKKKEEEEKKEKYIYMLQQQHVNNINIYGNQGNELFNQEPKSVGDKICEFFKNLFCCGCGCVKTRD